MSAGWPRLRFCEAPDVDSATRLDLHRAGVFYNGDAATLADGFSLGMPSVSSPAGARVQVLGDRTSMRIPLGVHGTKPAATVADREAALQSLLELAGQGWRSGGRRLDRDALHER